MSQADNLKKVYQDKIDASKASYVAFKLKDDQKIFEATSNQNEIEGKFEYLLGDRAEEFNTLFNAKPKYSCKKDFSDTTIVMMSMKCLGMSQIIGLEVLEEMYSTEASNTDSLGQPSLTEVSVEAGA